MSMSASTAHSLAWTLDRGLIPVSQLVRLAWCHADDYAGSVFEGVGAWWCEEKGAWNARCLWQHVDRLILSIHTVLGINLHSRRQELFDGFCLLLARNGVPGQNTYSRPRAWNNNPRRGVGELVNLVVEMFTQEMTTYLTLPPGRYGATLWWDQLLYRSHPWSVVKWEGNYAEGAARKRLCNPAHPNPIQAHEVLTLSPHQPFWARWWWKQAVWSETTGSRIVISDGEALSTSHARHLALDSVSLRVIKEICRLKSIPFREGNPTVDRLMRATGCAAAGSWSEMTLIQRLLIGQDPRLPLTPGQEELLRCRLVGHEPREYDCAFNGQPDQLIVDVQGEYTDFLHGRSRLRFADDFYCWIDPIPS